MIPPLYTIYTQNSCGYCHLAKSLMNDRGVAFIEVSLEHDQEARIMLKEMKCRTVPQIFDGELHIGGYTELVDYLNQAP